MSADHIHRWHGYPIINDQETDDELELIELHVVANSKKLATSKTEYDNTLASPSVPQDAFPMAMSSGYIPQRFADIVSLPQPLPETQLPSSSIGIPVDNFQNPPSSLPGAHHCYGGFSLGRVGNSTIHHVTASGEQSVHVVREDVIRAALVDGDNDETTLLHNPDPMPLNPRSRAYWRQELLRALSLEVNMVLFLMVVSLIVVLAVSNDGHSSNNNPNSPSTNQQNGAIQIPGVLEVAPTHAPTTFLDLLNLPQYTLQAMENSRSPQSKAYQWLANSFNNQSSTLVNDLPKWRLKQRFALATFYYSTRGEYWVKKHGWLAWDEDECTWEQVFLSQRDTREFHCNNMGEIKELSFERANNLHGTIPPELSLLGGSFQVLKFHQQLQLEGTIPTEVGLLTKLTQITLGLTNIAGTLPTELGYLQCLDFLFSFNNQISGQIPSEIGKLGKLSSLILATLNLSGSVPVEIFQLPGLVSLVIDGGPDLNTEYALQDVFGNAQQLEMLSLSFQSFGADMSIPSEIGTMTKLTKLLLSASNIFGTVPTELGMLEQLTSLGLNENAISGSFPNVLIELTNLKYLHVDSNKLHGPLPPNLFSILTNLVTLRAHSNHFSGMIPTEVGLLSSLQVLELKNTDLSGTMPTELLALTNLTLLALQNTSVSGSIPEQLCDKMYQKKYQCFGRPTCPLLSVKTSATVCEGTVLCGCDCAPCP
ncbi:LRR receptor-like serine threonine-protein kinase [Seminavis robusta]|uniref:LRR receptor-like serine threonine-protein kinase n=1 Tax=Seminavis robusta TaxID=568900 RepID=A0A9N8I105_9STRA|nr:LRR receptor-like serine threonine-protein kinase [Seminavis robusta]|eukprot:Sro3014_g342120.1 LRR receptor-like serine threonine-protein kinase (707) ;mRNA; f:6632-9064